MITFKGLGHYGRLGNQLFQIASTIGIAIENNDVAAFTKWRCNYTKKDMSHFFKNPISENLPLNFDAVTYQEPFFNYKKVSYTGNLILQNSYFQSDKYFNHCESLIRHQFEPSERIFKKIIERYGEILSKETCSLHIRKGDYNNSSIHSVCDINYYNKAIGFTRNKKVEKFLIFSDDIKWCKENFPTDFIFVENTLSSTDINSIYRSNDSDVEEMFLMSLCKHNIIANSSFSWWGSWLNNNENKIIVAPSRWFGSDELNYKDIYTKQMIFI
jgi:hypothetical protein